MNRLQQRAAKDVQEWEKRVRSWERKVNRKARALVGSPARRREESAREEARSFLERAQVALSDARSRAEAVGVPADELARRLGRPAARARAVPGVRAPVCRGPRVPVCLLEALRAGQSAEVERRGQGYAVVAGGRVQATRKERERAVELLDAARAEAARALPAQRPAGEVASAEERKRLVLITPQRPDGEAVRFAVVDVSRLVPSHRATDFSPHPKYPPGVQERVYHMDDAEQLKVVRGAQALNPEILLARTPDPLTGPPVVTEPNTAGEHLVLGGNGRTLMLQRAYSGPNTAAQRYREELIKRAADFGLDGAAIRAAFERPVLVRVLENVPFDAPREVLISAVRRTNESLSQALDAATLGVAQARVLSPESVRTIGEALGDGEQTLREVMAERPEVFRAALQRDGILTPQNLSQYFAANGALTDEAKTRLEAMFLGLVLASKDRIQATAPALRRKLERAVPALIAVRGAVPAYDLTPDVQAAVDLLNDAAARKLTLEDLLGQASLLPGETRTPRVEGLARMLEGATQRQVTEAFRRWAGVAIHDPRQATMFGDPPTPEQAFAVLMGGRIPNPGRRKAAGQPGARCERCAGSGRIAPWAGKITGCPTCGGTGSLLAEQVGPPPLPGQHRLFNPSGSAPPAVPGPGPGSAVSRCEKFPRCNPGSSSERTWTYQDVEGAPLRIGQRVRVAQRGDDETFPKKYRGRKGTVNALSFGTQLEDGSWEAIVGGESYPGVPFVRVVFDEQSGEFWATELRRLRAKRKTNPRRVETDARSTEGLVRAIRKRCGAIIPNRLEVTLVAVAGVRAERRLTVRKVGGGAFEVVEAGKVNAYLSAELAGLARRRRHQV